MASRFPSIVFIVFAVLLQSGCATLDDAKAARGTGEVRVYAHPKELVWNSLLDVLGTTNLTIVSEDKTEGVVLAKRPMKNFSFGENVAIFVEAANGGSSTRVEVVNKRAVASNTTAVDWATRIFDKLDKIFM